MKKIYLILMLGILLVGGVWAGVFINNTRTKNIDIDKGFEDISYDVDCECLDLKDDTCYEYGKCFVYMNIDNFKNISIGYFIGQIDDVNYNDMLLKIKLQEGYDVWKLNQLQRIEPIIIPVVKGDVS